MDNNKYKVDVDLINDRTTIISPITNLYVIDIDIFVLNYMCY